MGEGLMTNMTRVVGAALFLALAFGAAQAADPVKTVKIGVLYPLTGNAASAGASAKDAVDLGVEIVSADHQGNPSVGQSQTLRLITEEKVVAMLGAYHSSVAITATAMAERQG